MFQNKKAVARGIVAQLLLEEQKYKDNLPNTPEYKEFMVVDEVTSSLDKLTLEFDEVQTKAEKLRKELSKLDERREQIFKETAQVVRKEGEEDYYAVFSWCTPSTSPSDAKKTYVNEARNAKFNIHDWYPDHDQLATIIRGQLEAQDYNSFDEVLDIMRVKYQK